MTNQEAREELADLADGLDLIPSTRKGQAMQMALDALKEQTKGRWIETREQNDAEPAIIRQCSRCGGFLERGRVGTNYCPCCGAKMQTEEVEG